MSMFSLRGAQTALRTIQKAELRTIFAPTGPGPIDTGMERGDQIADRRDADEAMARYKAEGPNAEYRDLNALATAGAIVQKSMPSRDLELVVTWFRQTFPAESDHARDRDDLEEMAREVFRHLSPDDQRRILGRNDLTAPPESNAGASMTQPIGSSSLKDDRRPPEQEPALIDTGLRPIRDMHVRKVEVRKAETQPQPTFDQRLSRIAKAAEPEPRVVFKRAAESTGGCRVDLGPRSSSWAAHEARILADLRRS